MRQNDWTEWLRREWQEPYFRTLASFIHDEYEKGPVYPPKQQVFTAFEACSLSDIRVVILGQDPYHQKGQAHGLCFSVNPGCAIPPSLQNIYRELQNELGCYIPNNGYLMPWAEQGVFLLNTVMTVRDSSPRSHAGRGWETFTDHAIERINRECGHTVFLLWGRDARSKAKMIDRSRHLVLEAPHPSPLSAYNGFFGCGHFRKANEFLQECGIRPVDWQIPNI